MEALIQDGKVAAYPYSIHHLRQDNPDSSIADTPASKSRRGVEPVRPTDEPAYNAETHKLVERTPVHEGLEWVQVWEVVARTQQEILDSLPYHDKATAKAQVLEWADEFLAPLEQGYSKKEVHSWPVKGPAAINYLDGSASAAETLILQAEVDALQMIAPGTTIAQVAAAIAMRAEPYLVALAFTSALRQIVNAQIDATTELAEIPPILEAAIAAATAKAVELGLLEAET